MLFLVPLDFLADFPGFDFKCFRIENHTAVFLVKYVQDQERAYCLTGAPPAASFQGPPPPSSTPTVIRKLSNYMFTSSARIATAMSDVGQKESAATAVGAVKPAIGVAE